MIVNAYHHLASTATHEVDHPLIVLERKIHAVTGGLPVRRVHVMERVRPVVAFGAVKPREVFDVGTRQALPGGREVFLDPQQVDSRAGGSGTERLPGDLAGEGMVL